MAQCSPCAWHCTPPARRDDEEYALARSSDTTDPAQRRDRATALRSVADEVERIVVGQHELVESLLIGLLADGHVLLEGVPGLAKSLAAESLARAVGGTFRRIQFTPDLLPSDVVGTQVYQPASGTWSTHEGPVFANLVLADEINRAPAKVQSALLEAMQERQVSLAGETHPLPEPFLVLATQNPLDQEGTYALPEAQLDRFMLKVVVDYPAAEHERGVVRSALGDTSTGGQRARQVAALDDVLAARKQLGSVHVDDLIVQYAVALVGATREPGADLAPLVRCGASPRASIAVAQAARAHAFLAGNDYVSPHDVKAVARNVLRHRVLTTFEADARGMTSADIVTALLDSVPVP